jgi:hypothetical protein
MNTTETNTAGTFGDFIDFTKDMSLRTKYGTVTITGSETPFYPNGSTSSGTLSAVNMPSLKRLEVKEVGETIEMIYKETLNINFSPTIHLNPIFQQTIFKIVYSCVDGKWNKSERIYGEIVPAQEEYYDFE